MTEQATKATNSIPYGNKGFYEQQGMVRHMIIISEPHRDALKALAKQYGVKQGEVVEVLLDKITPETHTAIAERKKSSISGKTTKTKLMKKMKNLSKEQLAAIDAILESNQS